MVIDLPYSIPQFAEVCKSLDSDEIWAMIDCISDELKDEILICHADPESPEPYCSAMKSLGQKFNVQSLIEF